MHIAGSDSDLSSKMRKKVVLIDKVEKRIRSFLDANSEEAKETKHGIATAMRLNSHDTYVGLRGARRQCKD